MTLTWTHSPARRQDFGASRLLDQPKAGRTKQTRRQLSLWDRMWVEQLMAVLTLALLLNFIHYCMYTLGTAQLQQGHTVVCWTV